jgi:UDP-N-acetylmuramoylalanine--D-glutamate ligase
VNGQKIAILGAGRSGIAVARAAKARGAEPTIYDAKPLGQLPKLDEGIKIVGNHTQPFTANQADILVTSPGVDSRSPILKETQKNGVEIIGEVEFAYRIAQSRIIAITGTNGKSTTTVMAWLCMNELKPGNAKLCGNIYGSGYDEVPLVEAAASSGPEDVLVAEISSFQLEWIDEFRPKCAAITNITPDHLNRYNGFADYAATKRKIYSNMGNGDTYVHHSDLMTTPSENAPFTVLKTLYDNREIYLGHTRIQIENLPFKECHNIQNAAMAATLAMAMVTPSWDSPTPEQTKEIEQGLKNFHGIAHRMERMGSKNGVELINNSMCTNPGAIVASSSSIHSPQHLLIGGITKDLDFTPVGEYLAKSENKAYLFGSDGDKISEQLKGSFPVFTTMGEAFAAAINTAKPGEVVMLAPGCASMDQYLDFRARGDEFRQLAKEWLDD